MKKGKISAILLAAAFAVAAVVSCVLLSLVKRVEVRYLVSENADVTGISRSLDALKGKCIALVSDEDIEKAFDEHPYFYLAEKPVRAFPNIVRLTVKERREVYTLSVGGKNYLLDENGILLAEIAQGTPKPAGRTLIDAEFSGITVKTAVLGKKLETSSDELFNEFIEMTAAVSLTDNVKAVRLVSQPERSDVLYKTYTGVTIEIPDANDGGKEKAVAAFKAYNDSANDYYKSFDRITAIKTKTGEIVVEWTENLYD